MSDTISARFVTRWVHRAASLLEESQAEINRMNVFPIADSDTGSNMAHTVGSARAELQEAVRAGTVPAPGEATDADLPVITALLATGAVKGARGNSGMALSQVFRALSDAAARGPIDSAALVGMLEDAVGFVQTAIASPVEGTILTVMREAAVGAREALEAGHGLIGIVEASLGSARAALFDTPNQLAVLAEAGVYDAGGAGFILMLKALLEVLTGEKTEDPTEAAAEAVPVAGAGVASHGSPAELELLFFFSGDADPLREMLDEHGDSIVVAPVSDTQAKVHVHTLEAGVVLERAFALGEVTELRIEVLPSQPEQPAVATARAERPIIALVSGYDAAEEASENSDAEGDGGEEHADGTGGAGADGSAEGEDIFAAVGALSLDPTATEQEIYAAFDQLPGDEIAVLTNGADPSGLLAAAQREGHNRQLYIIDTDSLVGGLAALAVFDPTNDWDDNTADMLDASVSQRWWQGAPEDLPRAVDTLLADGGELVTFITSAPAVADVVAGYADRAREQHPGVEFHEHHARGLGSAVQVGVE